MRASVPTCPPTTTLAPSACPCYQWRCLLIHASALTTSSEARQEAVPQAGGGERLAGAPCARAANSRAGAWPVGARAAGCARLHAPHGRRRGRARVVAGVPAGAARCAGGCAQWDGARRADGLPSGGSTIIPAAPWRGGEIRRCPRCCPGIALPPPPPPPY